LKIYPIHLNINASVIPFMKRVAILIIAILCVSIALVLAAEVQVQEASEDQVILELTDISSLDIRLGEVTVTVETEGLTDTYVADADLTRDGDMVLVVVDVSDAFEDYESFDALVVRGTVEEDGVTDEFAKRIAVRSSGSQVQFAAPTLEGGSTAYWVVGILLILTVIVLFLLVQRTTPLKKSAAERNIRKAPIKKAKKQAAKAKTRKRATKRTKKSSKKKAKKKAKKRTKKKTKRRR
jgi:hypothetical protein